MVSSELRIKGLPPFSPFKDNPEVKELTADQIKKTAEKMKLKAVKPLHNSELRKKLVELHKATEQTIDTVSKDEITALQILYSKPYKSRLRFEQIKEHIIGSLNIEKEDFDSVPFKPEGGLGKAYQLFGEELWTLMDELNEVLAA